MLHDGVRVLVVDDAPLNRLVLTEALAEDYEVLLAADGPTAVRLAGGEVRPDLILLDVNMPDMDGYMVCEQLKESARTRDIPVIFVTGRTDAATRIQCLAMGAVGFVVSIDPADDAEGGPRDALPGLRVFRDRDGAVSRLYGVAQPGEQPGAVRYGPCAVLLDPLLRVIAVRDGRLRDTGTRLKLPGPPASMRGPAY